MTEFCNAETVASCHLRNRFTSTRTVRVQREVYKDGAWQPSGEPADLAPDQGTGFHLGPDERVTVTPFTVRPPPVGS